MHTHNKLIISVQQDISGDDLLHQNEYQISPHLYEISVFNN